MEFSPHDLLNVFSMAIGTFAYHWIIGKKTVEDIIKELAKLNSKVTRIESALLSTQDIAEEREARREEFAALMKGR